MHNKTFLSALDTSKLEKLKQKELTKLKKIQLSVIDDAKSRADVLVERKRSLDGFTNDAEEADDNIREANNVGNQILEFLESQIAAARDEIEDAIDILNKIEDGAKALGMSPKDIDNYDYLLDALQDVQKDIDGAENTADNLADLLGR